MRETGARRGPPIVTTSGAVLRRPAGQDQVRDNPANASSRRSSGVRRTAEGCTVARSGSPSNSSSSPRCRVSRNEEPSSALAAVAPSVTRTVGRTVASSDDSHGRQARTCSTPGVRWIRRLPSERKRSSSRPAGPTKGSPARSSLSPGCSPASTIRAPARPDPNTVCVASAYSSHAVHPAALRRSSSSSSSSSMPREFPAPLGRTRVGRYTCRAGDQRVVPAPVHVEREEPAWQAEIHRWSW